MSTNKAKIKCVTSLNGPLQQVFGISKHISLPFSTPNSGLDEEVISKAFIKPTKFKLCREMLEFLNTYLPIMEYNGYECKQKDFKFHLNGYLSRIKYDESPFYKACPVCKRKILESYKGFECRFCMKYYDNWVPSYSLSANISDQSDTI